MSPLTSAPLCSTLLFVGIFVFVSAEQKNITAESGQNVTLTCRAPNIIVVKWSRADLGLEYVLLYRDGAAVPDEQHESFKNRVDLQDRQMKDGDVTLILKNVTAADTGTYECRVVQSGTGGLTLLSSIYLRVVAPPGPGAPVGLIVGLSVAVAAVAAAAVGYFIYRKWKHKEPGKPRADV